MQDIKATIHFHNSMNIMHYRSWLFLEGFYIPTGLCLPVATFCCQCRLELPDLPNFPEGPGLVSRLAKESLPDFKADRLNLYKLKWKLGYIVFYS